MTIEILKKEDQIGNHGSWVNREYGAGQFIVNQPGQFVLVFLKANNY